MSTPKELRPIAGLFWMLVFVAPFWLMVVILLIVLGVIGSCRETQTTRQSWRRFGHACKIRRRYGSTPRSTS
jgi:uncharacterized membrane protein